MLLLDGICSEYDADWADLSWAQTGDPAVCAGDPSKEAKVGTTPASCSTTSGLGGEGHAKAHLLCKVEGCCEASGGIQAGSLSQGEEKAVACTLAARQVLQEQVSRWRLFVHAELAHVVLQQWSGVTNAWNLLGSKRSPLDDGMAQLVGTNAWHLLGSKLSLWFKAWLSVTNVWHVLGSKRSQLVGINARRSVTNVRHLLGSKRSQVHRVLGQWMAVIGRKWVVQVHAEHLAKIWGSLEPWTWECECVHMGIRSFLLELEEDDPSKRVQADDLSPLDTG